MRKQRIRLTESDLRNIVKKSVGKILSEANYNIGTGETPNIEEIQQAIHDVLSDVEWLAQEQVEEDPEEAKSLRAVYAYLLRANNLLQGCRDKAYYNEYDDDAIKDHLSKKSLGHDKYGHYVRHY